MKDIAGQQLFTSVNFNIPAKYRGLIAIAATFGLALLVVNFISPVPLNYFDFHSLSDVSALSRWLLSVRRSSF